MKMEEPRSPIYIDLTHLPDHIDAIVLDEDTASKRPRLEKEATDVFNRDFFLNVDDSLFLPQVGDPLDNIAW